LIKIPNRLGKKFQKTVGGIFLTHTVESSIGGNNHAIFLQKVGVSPPVHPVIDCRLLVAELFRSPARRHWITAQKTWHQQNHWPHFVTSSRHTCSGSLFLTTCWTST